MLLFIVYIIKKSFASCVLESACFTQRWNWESYVEKK